MAQEKILQESRLHLKKLIFDKLNNSQEINLLKTRNYIGILVEHIML